MIGLQHVYIPITPAPPFMFNCLNIRCNKYNKYPLEVELFGKEFSSSSEHSQVTIHFIYRVINKNPHQNNLWKIKVTANVSRLFMGSVTTHAQDWINIVVTETLIGIKQQMNHTTIICFLIYKEWLLLSLENRKRKSVIALDFFKNEVNLRLQIYEKCMCIDALHIDRMKELVLHL